MHAHLRSHLDVMEAAVVQTLLAAAADAPSPKAATLDLVPISPWSTLDANISPHQRLTGRPPRVMDLASFGSRAVVLKPPTHQHKPSLSPRGWIGSFLGRSRYSKGPAEGKRARYERIKSVSRMSSGVGR